MVSARRPPGPPDPESLFHSERQRLWAIAYRLTGTREDADDIVQEAFARLLAQQRESASVPTPQWLSRVAANLGIDALRRRRRRSYPGPWLPAPIETSDTDPLDGIASADRDPETRYGTAEGATFAFLVALEALTPRQRAVLVLRDVVGHSCAETAQLLDTSEGNVRILHLRARRALEQYDHDRCIPTREFRERHRVALERFLECLAAQDARGLEAILAESVETVTDAAGEYTALATPLRGRQRVARLYLVAALHRRAGGTTNEIRLVNGLPAALVTLHRPVRRQAPRSLLRLELDRAGAIRVVHAVLAPRKLAALRTS
jgi:RNA polymerase sigma-70 factor (ECF subfamily)